MGVDYDHLSDDFIVDCLGAHENCVLRGPNGEYFELTPGQRTGYQSKQLIYPPIAADYSTWQAIGSGVIPEPSPTPSLTPTATATDTPTPTATIIYTWEPEDTSPVERPAKTREPTAVPDPGSGP